MSHLRDPRGNPKLFVSYHHEDGEDTAKALAQEVFKRHSGVDVFMALQGIIPGEEYEPKIHGGMLGSDAVISIFTERYPDRRWCNREVEWAREPRLVRDRSNCWQVTALLVVEDLQRTWSRPMRDFGGCPMIRWEDDRSCDIIDRALIEAVFNSYNRRCMENLKLDAGEIAINWIPDPLSLARLKTMAQLESQTTVVYPGTGLPRFAEERLEQAFDLKLRAYKGERK